MQKDNTIEKQDRNYLIDENNGRIRCGRCGKFVKTREEPLGESSLTMLIYQCSCGIGVLEYV